MQISALFSSFPSSFPSPFILSRRLLLGLFCGLLASAALADPSARVGRIAYLEGDVDFRASEQADSAQASVNWPLTGGNRITTAPNARTEIRIGSSVIRLDGQSELLITALDDNRLALYLPYGSATVRIRNAEVAREFSLQTPQGQVTLLQPGRLRIDAGRNAPTTSLHVIDGMARFDTPQSNQGGQPTLIVAAGSRLDTRLDSNNGFSQITSLRVPAANDGFDGWSLARDRNDDRSQSVRYVSAETTGYEELDRSGVWRTTVDYGPVWTPTVVAADWAPYRDGRWLWVAPWGWTWVDNASWGYAPSHYGRWVSIDNRWCWTPGAVVARPVWAPALVGWQGGVNFSHAGWAAQPPTTGWFPLAPREVYVPSYAVSRTYVERVNINHVTNVTQINNYYRDRNTDRNHDQANYRYRALASNVTSAAAAPALIGRARESTPQHMDGQRKGAQLLTAPGTPVTRPAALATLPAPALALAPAAAPITTPAPAPVRLPDRAHPDDHRSEGPGHGMHDRRLVSTPQATQPQALERWHQEQARNAGHHGRPAQQPLMQDRVPATPAPMQPHVAGPPLEEHRAPPHGRGHHEVQRVTEPARPTASIAVPAPPPRPAVAPAALVPKPQHPEHHERHEGRAPHERNAGGDRRER